MRKKVRQEYMDLTNSELSDSMPAGPRAYRKAISYALAGTPQPRKTKAPSPRADRKPPVAPPADGIDLDRFFEEDGDLSSLARKMGVE